MTKIGERLKDIFPLLIIASIELFLFFINYKHGTYLLGWDNLFPEANFQENITRSIFSIWQQYRGLGLLDGMSYAANLPHYLFLSFLSIFLPQNILRYFFVFFMHFLGGVGIYFLTRELIESHKGKNFYALVGSLLYLLNIATVQMFYAPYELFTVHFAFLPILVLFLYKYLKTGKRIFFYFLAISLLVSIPEAHVPTVFIVSLIALLSIIFFHLIQEGRRGLKRILVVLILIFLINSFWGLPYFYTAFKSSKTIANSKINIMSTEDIYLRNKEFGDFIDTAMFKGFGLKYVDIQNGVNGYMMSEWRNHTNNIFFLLIAMSFFAVAIFGLYKAVKSKDKKFYPFILLFIFSFLMLGDDIPVLGIFSWFLNTFIPYFGQIFRFTFTKFSILYAFSFSIFFSLGLVYFFESNILERRRRILTISLFLMILWYGFPSFTGHFLYDNLKLQIPKEYLDMMNYFKGQNKNDRISTFPQPSYYGWTYTNWGYRGSGFIWYGIPQSTLDGAFYPWSHENENYYWEISQAVYSGNSTQLGNILEKYQVKWLIVDGNVISPSSSRSLYLDRLSQMILATNKIVPVQEFGKINVYQVNLDADVDNFVSLETNLPVIGPKYEWNNYDRGFADYGNYITQNQNAKIKMQNDNSKFKNEEPDIFYPFRSLFTGRQQSELEFQVKDLDDYFSFQAPLPPDLSDKRLNLPTLGNEEVTEIDRTNLTRSVRKYPLIYLDNEQLIADLSSPTGSQIDSGDVKGGKLEVRVPKIGGFYGYVSNSLDLFSQPVRNCDQFNQGVMRHDKVHTNDGEELRLTSVNSSNCLDFDFPYLPQRLGYLVTVESRYEEGKSLLFSVINKNSQRVDLETYLPKQPRTQHLEPITSYSIIPPMERYGEGYTLHFDNISIGRVRTVNDLGRITLNPIPYDFLTGIKIIKNNELRITNYGNTENNIKVEHPNPSYYQLKLDSSTIGGVMASQAQPATPEVSLSRPTNITLVLSQSFDDGWHAYQITNDWLTDSWYMKLLIPLFGRELKDHVLVNNWENGWEIGNLSFANSRSSIISPTTVAIIYLPQYLEYLGFVLLGGLLIFLILFKPKVSDF